MKEQDIRVFIDATTHYFEQITRQSAQIGAPYLSTHKDLEHYDYSGLIGIAGKYRGCIYFTAPRPLLRHLLVKMGEPQHDDEHLLDMVGEIANTLSGNARRHFGPQFIISVPVAMKGRIDNVRPPSDLLPYVIPISWNAYRASLVMCIGNGSEAGPQTST